MAHYDEWIKEIGNLVRKAGDELRELADDIYDHMPAEDEAEELSEEEYERWEEVSEFAGELWETASDLCDKGYDLYTTEVRSW